MTQVRVTHKNYKRVLFYNYLENITKNTKYWSYFDLIQTSHIQSLSIYLPISQYLSFKQPGSECPTVNFTTPRLRAEVCLFAQSIIPRHSHRLNRRTHLDVNIESAGAGSIPAGQGVKEVDTVGVVFLQDGHVQVSLLPRSTAWCVDHHVWTCTHTNGKQGNYYKSAELRASRCLKALKDKGFDVLFIQHCIKWHKK